MVLEYDMMLTLRNNTHLKPGEDCGDASILF
jgi:hypothetical protein